MATSFGFAGRRLAIKFLGFPRHKVIPPCQRCHRLMSATASKQASTKPETEALTAAGDTAPKPESARPLQVKPALDLPSEEDNFVESFIPISRRSLVRELMQEEFLTESEAKQFERFATSLDAAIVNQYHGNLAELKHLFDPVNPDKDTVMTRKVLQREKKDSEFWLLQKLAVLMERANFHELPEEVIHKALEEHQAGEGVMVSVNKKNYDILRFWALGREIPHQSQPWYKYLPKLFFYKATKQSPPPPQKYYKRVVVAVRPKGQDKLSLKIFKEVPASALEQLLPDGKIKMSKFDQGLIATSVGVGALTLLVKAVSTLADVQLKWTLIVGGVTGLTALRFWNSYKNRRMRYLMQLSRTLYYKNVANNRGLLALLVDRAQDETFKETLIMYTFLLSQAPSRGPEDGAVGTTSLGIRSSILERNIERWVKSKTGTDIEFDSSAASVLLKAFGILLTDSEDNNTVIPIEAAILSLPKHAPSIIDRTEDVELEEGYDKVYMEHEDVYDKEDKKERAHGWS